MRLASITVERFRSITKAYKIRLGHTTVLVGPNNEGKSNILRALATAMNILTREHLHDPGRARSVAVAQYRSIRFFDWTRDFPVALQATSPNGQSIIVLEFELTEDELRDYRAEIKSKLSGSLPLKIALDRNQTATVSLHKKGPGAEAQSKKAREIARFVASRLRFEHVQAVRTARSAQDIVEELVAKELSRVESDERYREALRQVADLQRPVLEKLSANIRETLVAFLPEVEEVVVEIPQENRYEALRRSCQIYINDGTRTLLQYKGDGVQSLAALGIMRHVSETSAVGKNLVIAVEEPESHLHPSAIHGLKGVLSEMSGKHQIVLTTHNPLFVDRVNVKANIIVHANRARPARTIEEIRDILGVRAADNLRHADLVLVVEGQDDCIALRALFCHCSDKLKQALADGVLALDPLAGSGNLSYKLSMLRTSLCLYHCFLDDDGAGKRAFDRARQDGLLDVSAVHFARCLGKIEAELEDWYRPEIYLQALHAKTGMSALPPKFSSNKKWSDRMAEACAQLGKPWDEFIKMELKLAVAQAVAGAPAEALLEVVKPAFQSLCESLEQRLEALRSARVAAV